MSEFKDYDCTDAVVKDPNTKKDYYVVFLKTKEFGKMQSRPIEKRDDKAEKEFYILDMLAEEVINQYEDRMRSVKALPKKN